MVTVVMQENKNIKCTTTSQLHQYENNSEQIRCIIPCKYDGVCLKNITAILFYKDENGYGGQLELELSEDAYNENYHQFINRINSQITSHVGKLCIWLQLYDNETDYILETDETYLTIVPTKTVMMSEDSKQQNYFDQWLVKMTQIQNITLKLQKDIVDLSNSSRQEIERLTLEVEKLKGGEVYGN
jgi:hypothetical protein